MPGVWLGENSVPELTKIDDHLIGFAHDTNRSLWPSVLIVAGIGIPCCVVCTLLALYGDGPVNSTIMKLALFAFTLTVIGAVSYACWFADATVINTQSRRVIRNYHFLGARIWQREFAIHDGDFFSIATSDDEQGAGSFHRVYVCRSKPKFLFAAIHLPTTDPSATLMHAVNEIAQGLGIENRGYTWKLSRD